MEDLIAEILSIIVIIAIIGGIIFGLGVIITKSAESHDNAAWNDGHCSCGGTWTYEQAVGHRYDTSYIYVCDDCGKRIEIYEMR